jgi:glycerophosphoryl diester phosphodiesterase
MATNPSSLDRAATESTLLLRPLVVAHRGASGLRPEHTLGAFRAAIRMGADDIELDLVMTADRVLVVRHDNELSRTTDVASCPRFAGRRTTRTLDGVVLAGWFAEDFTLAEIKQLTAREPHPLLRASNTAHDGLEGVPTLDEVLAMVAAESIRGGRQVGVMLEIKHPTHLAARGLDVVGPLLATLRRHGLDGPWSPITLMAFEPGVLRKLATRSRLAVVQLLGPAHERPWDLELAGDPRTFADLATPEGLEVIDEYADGIAAVKELILPRDIRDDVGVASSLVRDAHRRGLTVHVWTLRAENIFLPIGLRRGDDPSALGDLAGEVRAFLAAGVDGVITDQPDVAVAVAQPAEGDRHQAS